MGQYVMRTAPDEDLYLEWSTNSDGWQFIGTRAEMLAYLLERNGTRSEPEQMLRYVDQHGTSNRSRLGSGPALGAWNDGEVTVRDPDEPGGYLPRGLLGDYARAHLRQDRAAAQELLLPFEQHED